MPKSAVLPPAWQSWSLPAKIKLLGQLRAEDWRRRANPGQVLPVSATPRVWYVQGARGSGKTQTGSEALAELALKHPAGEWAAIGPTFGDARDTQVEGESGLLAVLGPAVTKWNRSIGELHLANGAVIRIDGADDGALRIQGKNLRGAWADEVGLWRQWDKAWNESLQFAVRKAPAIIVATGTPKGKQGIVKQLLEERDEAPDEVIFTRTHLEDNLANLHPAQVASLRRRFEGTSLGRQELEGEILDEVEGALWKWHLIENHRVGEDPLRIGNRIVVAIDPAVTSTDVSDETGIIACSTDHTGQGYVLDDRSGTMTPTEWAEKAIKLYRELKADRIVAEVNNGGDLVETVLRQVDASIPYKGVWAARGKRTRAEPVAALYEQKRIHHVGTLPELETELTTWVPDEGESPNRLDALVWAFHELILDAPAKTHVAGGDVDPDEMDTGSITADLWHEPL